MDIGFINPYVRVAMNSTIPSGHNIMRRVIYDYELIYLEKGNFTLKYEGVEYTCSAGDFIFIRPGVTHSFKINKGEIVQPHIHFDITHRHGSEKIPVSFKDISDMTEEEVAWIHRDYFSKYPKTPILKIQNREFALGLFYSVIDRKNTPLMKKGRLIELISVIINDNFPGFAEEQSSVSIAEQIKDYIDSGSGIKMSLDDFEKRFFHSKFYLEKKFKEQYGKSIIKYRNERRMIFANSLLPKHSVSSTAERLGYQSIYAFSRAYKECYGFSPKKNKRL